MNSSNFNLQNIRISNVSVTEQTLIIVLTDGRIILVPVHWYPCLLHANDEERQNWRIIGNGHGIHWNALDEDISIMDILAGRPSAESQKSLKKWLRTRKNTIKVANM